MPSVSIIIPTHSRPHLLPRVVESARRAGREVEVIVVDDASTDETAEVCRTLKGINYVRVERNQGVAGARNIGILASTSDYVAFLDDDDLRLPGSLDAQVEALKALPEAGFVCGPVLVADQEYRLTGEVRSPQTSGDVFWDILELNFFVLAATVVVRKSRLLQVGLFKSRLQGIDDWDLCVRLAELFPVAVVNQPVCVYRDPTPGSGQGSSAQARHLLRSARHQLQLLRLPRAAAASPGARHEVRRRLVNRVADTLLWNALRRWPEGAYRFAWANFWGAMRLNPLRAARPTAYRKLLARHFAR